MTRRLSALLTHRLSTLTSTISGYADLLVDTPDPQEQRQVAMNVMETSSQIDDLLEGLRRYSRPLHPARRQTSARTLARETAALLDDSERRRVRVDAGSDAELQVDAQMLRQALLGLLQNALEAAAPDGTVLLRVTTGPEAKEDSEDDGEDSDVTARFAVWNEGTITLETPDAIFNPFFTTHARRMGLGLPIARQIAESHGGTLRLTANSEAEGGTCLALCV